MQALRDSLKPYLALYVGGMGAKGKNFYNGLARRYGWRHGGEDPEALPRRPSARGDRSGATSSSTRSRSSVPKERIADRLAAWRETPVTTLIVGSPQPEALQTLAELVL